MQVCPVLCTAWTRQQQIISGGVDGSLRLWNLQTGELRDCGKHDRAVGCCAALETEDGWQSSAALSAGWDGVVALWDVRQAAAAPVSKWNAAKKCDSPTLPIPSCAHTARMRSPPHALASFMTKICAPGILQPWFSSSCAVWLEECTSHHRTRLAAFSSPPGNSPQQSHSSPSQTAPGIETQLKSTQPKLSWPPSHPVAWSLCGLLYNRLCH
jgi:WD40 repeat protein